MEFYDLPYIGNVIIPTDELIFFQMGGSTTNQMKLDGTSVFLCPSWCQCSGKIGTCWSKVV